MAYHHGVRFLFQPNRSLFLCLFASRLVFSFSFSTYGRPRYVTNLIMYRRKPRLDGRRPSLSKQVANDDKTTREKVSIFGPGFRWISFSLCYLYKTAQWNGRFSARIPWQVGRDSYRTISYAFAYHWRHERGFLYLHITSPLHGFSIELTKVNEKEENIVCDEIRKISNNRWTRQQELNVHIHSFNGILLNQWL